MNAVSFSTVGGNGLKLLNTVGTSLSLCSSTANLRSHKTQTITCIWLNLLQKRKLYVSSDWEKMTPGILTMMQMRSNPNTCCFTSLMERISDGGSMNNRINFTFQRLRLLTKSAVGPSSGSPRKGLWLKWSRTCHGSKTPFTISKRWSFLVYQ